MEMLSRQNGECGTHTGVATRLAVSFEIVRVGVRLRGLRNRSPHRGTRSASRHGWPGPPGTSIRIYGTVTGRVPVSEAEAYLVFL